jgi:predicted HicB family RNase H-like nuclease
MGYLTYKGYKGTVEYSEADKCLFGKVIGLRKDMIIYEGQSIDELRNDFETAIDDYLSGCEAEGIAPARPFSGKLNLRMSPELHSSVFVAAKSTGTTINEFINRAITNELAREVACN